MEVVIEIGWYVNWINLVYNYCWMEMDDFLNENFLKYGGYMVIMIFYINWFGLNFDWYIIMYNIGKLKYYILCISVCSYIFYFLNFLYILMKI